MLLNNLAAVFHEQNYVAFIEYISVLFGFILQAKFNCKEILRNLRLQRNISVMSHKIDLNPY